MQITRLIYTLLIGFSSCLFSGCSQSDDGTVSLGEERLNDLNNTNEIKWIQGDQPNARYQSLGQAEIGVKYVSALEFLERKGEIIDSSDLADLARETVLLIEFSSLRKATRDPLELQQCRIDYEAAIEYLSFGIKEDLEVVQFNKEVRPSAVHFERDFGLSGRHRVLVFLTDFDHQKSFQLKLKERLFSDKDLKFEFISDLVAEENV